MAVLTVKDGVDVCGWWAEEEDSTGVGDLHLLIVLAM